MKEAYVSFKVAKLLKEKGFSWPTPKLYGKCRVYNGKPIDFDTECELKDEGKWDEITTAYMQYDMWWVKSDSDLGIPCPSQAVACRWLREEHEIDIIPTIRHSLKYAQESPFKDYTCRVYDCDGNIVLSANKWYSRYENAVEAALEYVLKNLI